METQYRIVTYSDPPDFDNVVMFGYTAKVAPCKVAMVMTPRAVDFSVAKYGDFQGILSKVGLRRMSQSLTSGSAKEEWVTNLPRQYQAIDKGTEDKDVKLDTELYMRVTSCRIQDILESLNIPSEKYDLFWDESSLDRPLKPVMRHAFHVDDFVLGMNETEYTEYGEIIKRYPEGGSSLRKELRTLCSKYCDRPTTYTRIPLRNFTHLLGANRHAKNVHLIIGGPFTEPLRYLREAKQPKRITAVAGSWKRDYNILENSFNFQSDMESGKAFLRMTKEKCVPLDLIPTELAKGKPGQPSEGVPPDDCPYELPIAMYEELFGRGLLLQTLERYCALVQKTSYGAWDLFAAMSYDCRDWFQWERFRYEVENEGSLSEKIIFNREDRLQLRLLSRWDSRMASADRDVMRKNKQKIFNRVKEVLNVEAQGYRQPC